MISLSDFVDKLGKNVDIFEQFGVKSIIVFKGMAGQKNDLNILVASYRNGFTANGLYISSVRKQLETLLSCTVFVDDFHRISPAFKENVNVDNSVEIELGLKVEKDDLLKKLNDIFGQNYFFKKRDVLAYEKIYSTEAEKLYVVSNQPLLDWMGDSDDDAQYTGFDSDDEYNIANEDCLTNSFSTIDYKSSTAFFETSFSSIEETWGEISAPSLASENSSWRSSDQFQHSLCCDSQRNTESFSVDPQNLVDLLHSGFGTFFLKAVTQQVIEQKPQVLQALQVLSLEGMLHAERTILQSSEQHNDKEKKTPHGCFL